MRYLLLNGDGTPCNVITRKRYLLLKWKGKLQFTGDKSVVMLKYYVNLHKKNNRNLISKKRIFMRDNYICAYCGEQLTNKSATVDHIVPKRNFKHTEVKDKLNSDVNRITSCSPCNRKKGGRTPEDAGMPLLYQPVPLKNTIANTMVYRAKSLSIPEWEKYI